MLFQRRDHWVTDLRDAVKYSDADHGDLVEESWRCGRHDHYVVQSDDIHRQFSINYLVESGHCSNHDSDHNNHRNESYNFVVAWTHQSSILSFVALCFNSCKEERLPIHHAAMPVWVTTAVWLLQHPGDDDHDGNEVAESSWWSWWQRIKN